MYVYKCSLYNKIGERLVKSNNSFNFLNYLIVGCIYTTIVCRIWLTDIVHILHRLDGLIKLLS